MVPNHKTRCDRRDGRQPNPRLYPAPVGGGGGGEGQGKQKEKGIIGVEDRNDAPGNYMPLGAATNYLPDRENETNKEADCHD